MFELKDLPSHDTLVKLGAEYQNPDVDGLQTWLIWASATSEMLSAFEANLDRTSGLSQTQFFVLILLKRNPDGLSIGVLADGVSVTSQTMTRIIDRMEAAGLCEREQHPQDRRAWVVRLTEHGAQVLGKALPAHYVWVAKLMSHFDESERDTLVKLMFKLKQEGVLPKANGG